MTKLSFLTILLVVLPSLLLAQGNYVANTPNNSTTATYGTFNTFVGPGAGNSGHATGNRNTVVGYNAGITLTSGSFNSFFGVDAGESNTSGNNNTFLGRAAGLSNSTGSYNVFTGAYVGQYNTTGASNVFSGYQAGYNNGMGANNVFIGYHAGYNNVSSQNVFTGCDAGLNNTAGWHNVFTGYQAGRENTEGSYNVFNGPQAGLFNTTGDNNVFSGFQTGLNNTTGDNNMFSGYRAGFANSTGGNNTFIGREAGRNNTTGSYNIIIGPLSGTAITNSDDNVLMGYNSQAEDGLQNAIAIGANSRVASSNALILGCGVNVGIGTSSPKSKLEVVADEDNASGLRLTQLTSQGKPTQATDQFLTVNEKGDVVKARYQLRISSLNEWSDKVFAPGYVLRPLCEVASYVQTYQHLPGVPSAEQVAKEGFDLVKMNATLLEKVEELTLYSIEQNRKARKQEERINQLEGLLKQLLEKKWEGQLSPHKL